MLLVYSFPSSNILGSIRLDNVKAVNAPALCTVMPPKVAGGDVLRKKASFDGSLSAIVHAMLSRLSDLECLVNMVELG